MRGTRLPGAAGGRFCSGRLSMRGCDERRRAHKIARGAWAAGRASPSRVGGESTRTGGAPTEGKNTGGNCNSTPRRTHGQVSCGGWLPGFRAACSLSRGCLQEAAASGRLRARDASRGPRHTTRVGQAAQRTAGEWGRVGRGKLSDIEGQVMAARRACKRIGMQRALYCSGRCTAAAGAGFLAPQQH